MAKLANAQKEARESRYWLRLAVATRSARIDELAWELDEAEQLVRMLTAAVKTAQASPRRGHP